MVKMIEKFKTPSVEVRDIHDTLHHVAAGDMFGKINELVDAVNDLDGLIGLTNNAVQALAKENNIHEKQIDELQIKIEPEKCEIHAENVLKETFVSIDEALKMGKQEHKIRSTNKRLREALDTAIMALKYIADGNLGFTPAIDLADKTLERINEIKGRKDE